MPNIASNIASNIAPIIVPNIVPDTTMTTTTTMTTDADAGAGAGAGAGFASLHDAKEAMESAMAMGGSGDVRALRDALERLKAVPSAWITPVALKETQLGVLVNKIARAGSTYDDSLQTLAKEIVQQWKSQVAQAMTPAKTAASSTLPSSSSTSTSTPAPASATPSSSSSAPSSSSSSNSTTAVKRSASDAAAAAAAASPSQPVLADPSAKRVKGTATPASSSSSSSSSSLPSFLARPAMPPIPAALMSSSGSASKVKPIVAPASSDASAAASGSAESNSPPASSSSGSSSPRSNVEYKLGALYDANRHKMQTTLLKALSDVQGSWEIEIVVRIEAALFAKFGGFNDSYRRKMREILLNLSDPNNPDINTALLTGAWTPERLVEMSGKEYASRALQEERNKHKKYMDAALRSDLDKFNGVTDQFRCGKCHERKCTYYQAQTRSADEPMTTFVRCVACGHRWKF